MKIAVDIHIPFLKGLPEKFADEVDYFSPEEFSRKRIADSDALIIRTVDKCTRDILQDARVQFIATTSVGFDHIDTDYCRERRIGWANTPGANAESVAHYFLLALVRLSLKHGFAMREKTVGLIGAGNTGKAIERFCRALGMQVFLNDPPRAEKEDDSALVSLETIQKECDIISIHTPLTREGKYKTLHLADRQFFDALVKKTIFINTARGEVAETEALKTAIKTSKIVSAVIDCWEGEPVIDKELLSLTEIPTPHIAGFSADGKANSTHMALEAVKKFFRIPLFDDTIILPPPANPVIDLNTFDSSKRIEYAILHTLNTAGTEEELRQSPLCFENLRTHFVNPREFGAYTILNATSEEYDLLRKLKFSFG